MVLTQSQIQDIKSVLMEVSNGDEWMQNLLEKLSQVIRQEFKAKFDQQEKKINNLQEQLNTERNKNIIIERKLDNLEQYGRRKNIRIFGIEEKRNENTENLILDLFQKKLNVTISPEMIQRSHRVGIPKDNSTRAIIVKFLSYKHKDMVFKSKKNLKGTRITIKEDLTAYRQELLREAYKKIDMKQLWTADGNIFTFLNGKKQIIRNKQNIDESVHQHQADGSTN